MLGPPLQQRCQAAGMERKEYSCIVIGAGLSGLYAAHQLRKSFPGDVLVVEAHTDIGGRVRQVFTPIDTVYMQCAHLMPAPRQPPRVTVFDARRGAAARRARCLHIPAPRGHTPAHLHLHHVG